MKTLLAIFSFVGLLVLNTTNCMAYDRVNSYQDLISRINNRCRDDVYLYQLRTVATVVMPAFFVMYFFLLKDDSLNVMNYRFFF